MYDEPYEICFFFIYVSLLSSLFPAHDFGFFLGKRGGWAGVGGALHA